MTADLDPVRGGIDPADVTYVVSTGAATGASPIESLDVAARVGETAARAFLDANP